MEKIFAYVKHTFVTQIFTGGLSVPLIIDHALPDYRWSFLISVAGLTKTPYCDLDVQLHGIQNQLKSKLNEQQAALESGGILKSFSKYQSIQVFRVIEILC